MFSEYQIQHPELEGVLTDVFLAMREGNFPTQFQHLMTKENLSYKLNWGPDDPLNPQRTFWDSIIGSAAEHGYLCHIPTEALEVLATEVLDDCGTTVLHTAAQSGCLNQLPESVLTVENLFRNLDSLHRSPALLATESGHFRQLPQKLWNKEFLIQPHIRGWTIFHAAAEKGVLDKIPKRFLTSQTMSLQTYDGTTPLHLAARHCHLGHVPNRALTLNSLKLRDAQGDSPLHLASITKEGLGTIPMQLLCEETLLQENKRHDTVLHILWREGAPPCVDSSIYTPKVLTSKDSEGQSILDYAIEKGLMELIPKERLDAGFALRDEIDCEAF